MLAEVAPVKNGVSAADIAPVAVPKASKEPSARVLGGGASVGG
jgi:hypothetical protein